MQSFLEESERISSKRSRIREEKSFFEAIKDSTVLENGSGGKSTCFHVGEGLTEPGKEIWIHDAVL